MANCPGILNREPKLIGVLNNNVINKGTGVSSSLLIEDTLLKTKWIKITGEDKFVYQYTNPQLDNNYFIQVTPDISEQDRIEIAKSEIMQNIYMDADISKTVYNIYCKVRPTVDIKISILATNIGKE
jgi:hypothetical protein